MGDGRRIALVIGVGSSPQAEVLVLRSLTGPEAAAPDVAAALRDHGGWTIHSDGAIVGEQALATTIQDAISDLS